MNSLSSNKPLLYIKALSKTYPQTGIEAINDISLSVKKGEFVSIIGPSGSGKSTLFDILSGVTNQTKGTVELNGKVIEKRTGKFGYMPQSPHLLPWRTVLENVILGLDVLHLPKQQSKQKAAELLKQFGLLKFANYYPDTLSGGMKQRVGLMRTILFRKDFLLLDEPFGALDALTRLSCQMWLVDVCKKLKPTVLFVTHDVREAVFLSDTIYVLSPRPGKIIKKIVLSPRPKRKELLTSQSAIGLEKQILSALFKNKTL